MSAWGGLAGVASHVGGPIWARAARLLPVPARHHATGVFYFYRQRCNHAGVLYGRRLRIFYNLVFFAKEFHIGLFFNFFGEMNPGVGTVIYGAELTRLGAIDHGAETPMPCHACDEVDADVVGALTRRSGPNQ